MIMKPGNVWSSFFRFDYVCLPIVNPRYKRERVLGPARNRPGALTRSDLCMSSSGEYD